MMERRIIIKASVKVLLITILISTMFLVACIEKPEASNTLNLIVNGKDITDIAMPIVESNRTLVPIRFVSEELGAKVTWDNKDKTALIEKEGSSIVLKINSRLINYNDGENYQLTDVEPKLLNKDEEGNLRTYVPLRLVSNALNIGVEWNSDDNSIYIDSKKSEEKDSISKIQIISQDKGAKIIGETIFQINILKEYEDASEVRFLLIDKGETSGFIVAKGIDIRGKYSYTPKIEDNGKKILVAAIYDENKRYIDGDAIPIEIKVEPVVELLGLKENEKISTNAELSIKTNFLPLYVRYDIQNVASSNISADTLTDVNDPLSTFTWNPMMKDNGFYRIRAVAYDATANPHYSDFILVEVDKERTLTLGGVKENMTIDKSVKLVANRNFDVSETEYLSRDVKTGIVTTIAKIPYGEYRWNPAPSDSGVKDLFVRVVDRGNSYESSPVRVVVDGNPKMFLSGIGPGQVINKDTEVNSNSNVKVNNIKYIITDVDTNKKQEITPIGESSKAVYTLSKTDNGNMTIEVQGEYKGSTIASEKIDFKVYHGEFFGPEPIVEKDKFIALASKLASDTYETIGMSAALQTAQAILESGFGQSVPVDKYTGLLSNNLFGIKGKGSIGSVTSNTWEVYNGETYRVDADFRAYNNLDESWKDHKALLLNLERYEPFTEVMFDYTKGAWALKRAGYATDPNYPIKLINIINQYNLDELDKIEI